MRIPLHYGQKSHNLMQRYTLKDKYTTRAYSPSFKKTVRCTLSAHENKKCIVRILLRVFCLFLIQNILP